MNSFFVCFILGLIFGEVGYCIAGYFGWVMFMTTALLIITLEYLKDSEFNSQSQSVAQKGIQNINNKDLHTKSTAQKKSQEKKDG
ncbi:MAG TPA: hypothetical protein ENG87_01945 [Candidatus Pacearchaeota archaeon]|nr:hypothetical protein [Candidatus Pacearchaeota archaeon]HDZ60704.1 hypothetical protein [Candidatus Pacearchaeota archaeon]